jgi:uncharacterized lipoprotein YddW (UPF0748 family)
MTTYPSDFLNYQHPRMERYSYSGYTDYIDALIGECHKYGIEVHAWFEVLCGSDFEGNKPSYIKDNWMTTNLTGKVSSFLDPTNEEVQQFLKDLVTEVVTKYDWDGISYD